VNLSQIKKSPISVVVFLLGAVLVIFGQSLIGNYPIDRRAGLLILVAFGLVFIFFGIWSIDKGLPRWLAAVVDWMSRQSINEWQFCCLIASLPLACVVPLFAGGEAKMISPVVALSSWLIAIGLILAGTWSMPAPLRRPPWRLVVLVIGMTGVAFLFRSILANRIPITLTGDEAAAGIAAEEFTRGAWNNIFITSWYAFPSFFFTIPAFFIGILGHTTLALRIPSALAGALTVTASFFVARAMFGTRTAWFTAAFLAVLHFHLHFSRIGLNNIWDGLWYVLAIGSLWVGWEKDRRNAYLLAGLSLGLSQYFYSSSHTLVVLILGWIIIAALIDRPRLKRAWPNLVIMFLVTGIVALPLAWFYIKHPNTFMEPMNRVALTSQWLHQEVINTGLPAWRIILRQVGLALGSYTYQPLRAWYTPNVPILRPFAAALFFIGIILLLLREQKWYIIPPLLWLFTFMAVGGFSESTPAAQRLVAAAPVCALVVGYGLSEGTALLEKVFEKGKRWITILSIVLMAALAIDELYFYFRVYTPYNALSVARSNDVIAQSLADYLETKPRDTQVIFFGSPNMGFYSIPSIQYLVPGIKGIDISETWSSKFKPQITSDHLLFVFLPNHLDQVVLVQADYPHGQLYSFQAADGNLLYDLYKVAQSP
jgi:4-amino-4-deoxy-L-arabinose transferase-like glycosyltransferase